MKKGFTMVEAMLALFFSSFLLLIVILLYQGFYLYRETLPYYDQNRIGFLQLQNEFTVSSHFQLEEASLCYEKFDNNYCLIFDQNRLVKKPGYEILLIDVKEGSFNYENATIILTINQESYRFKTIP